MAALRLALLGLLGLAARSAARCTAYSSQQQCTELTIGELEPCPGLDPGAKPFAVIGDYGMEGPCERNVAGLVQQFEATHGPMRFIATVGDNNYWDGGCGSMHANIGQYYGRFFTPGDCNNPPTRRDASEARFWPSLGNHDWDKYHSSGTGLPYFQYFSHLTGLENHGLYYNKTVDQVELFALNSNWRSSDPEWSQMRLWLQQRLGQSRARFRLVYFHHPPYTTAQHDEPASWMRWPFKEWGASMVLSGHQHTYERLEVADLTYVVNGLGGHHWLYSTASMQPPYQCTPEQGSKLRYNKAHGAMIAAVGPQGLHMCFYSTENSGKLVDSFVIRDGQPPPPSPQPAPTAAPISPPVPTGGPTTRSSPANPSAKPSDSANDSDGMLVAVLAIVASLMTVLAIAAVVGYFYMNRRWLQPPSLVSLDEPAAGNSLSINPSSSEYRRLGGARGLEIEPSEFTHAAL